jgi:AcrR family transcriptional regulator
MDEKGRIQQKAKELFMRYGFRSVTMDEIAGQLGVSKKTIYQFFKDKDELVESVIAHEIQYMQDVCTTQLGNSDNAVEELFKDMEALEEVIGSLNPQILFDLEKFYPQAYAKIRQHKNTFLLEVIKKNLHRGIREELYRPDLDVDIVSKFRLESGFIAFNQDLFPFAKYSLLQVANEIYYLFMHGIATAKGKKLIEKYILERQKNKSLAI